MKLKFGSFTQRVAMISLLLAVLIAAAVLYTRQIVDTTSKKSLASISQSQQIETGLHQLRASLQAYEQAIYHYSLRQDKQQYERVAALSGKVVFQATELLHTPVAQQTQRVAEPIYALETGLRRLQTEVRNLLLVMSNAGTFYPGMPILTEKLYPTNVTFMQAAELAILEAESSLKHPEQREILNILTETKYAWVQQISSVRVFIANRAGAFGEPQKSMQLNENNRRMFAQLVNLQLGKLNAYAARGQLGLQQGESLATMRQAMDRYEKDFQAAAKIYLSENWRADIPIMRDVIRPLLDEAWRDIGSIETAVGELGDASIFDLVETTGTLSGFIWLFSLFGYAVLVSGYLLFEYVVRRPMLQVAQAMDAYGQDVTYNPVIKFNTEETRTLVSAFSRMQKHVVSRQKRLESILDNAGEGIITFGDDRRIESFNNAAQLLFGYHADEVIGRDVQVLLADPGSEENPQFLRRIYGADPLKGALRFNAVVTAQRKLGSVFSLSVNLSELRIDDRRLFVAIVEDISERQEMLQHLQHLAEHDSLTGLYNRQFFMDELERVVGRSVRKRGDIQHALLYIDLDNFKFVNDTLGHLAGDKVLVEVTQMLRQRLRKSDLLARLGGDEFAVLLYDVDLPQANQAAEFYRLQLADYVFRYETKAIDVGCTIGVAMFTPDVGNKEDLLARADIACHIAKRAGRNAVHVYQSDDKENMTSMHADLGWARRIKQAIETDHFVLACQPIARTGTLAVASYEVLLRLRGDSKEFVMPAGFLPSAERFGLMLDIDRWVIGRAMASLAALHTGMPQLRYSVNLSAMAVCDTGILDFIKELLARYNVEPGTITFEITENVAIGNITLAVQFLEQLRALGCCTALDDFGIGYSSFAYLKDLPVDYVKIDGSFVKDIETNVLHRAMVKSMHEVAHAVGKKTVAEFVESERCLEMLRDIGVDYVQGYHIGKPVVVEGPQSFTE